MREKEMVGAGSWRDDLFSEKMLWGWGGGGGLEWKWERIKKEV